MMMIIIIRRRRGTTTTTTSFQSNLAKDQSPTCHHLWMWMDLFDFYPILDHIPPHANDISLGSAILQGLCFYLNMQILCIQCFSVDRTTPKIALFHGDLNPHLIHGSFGLHETPNQTASRLVQLFSAGFANLTNRQTDRPHYSVCSNGPHLLHWVHAIWPNNSNATFNSYCESSPGSVDECRLSTRHHYRFSNQTSWLGLWVCTLPIGCYHIRRRRTKEYLYRANYTQHSLKALRHG